MIVFKEVEVELDTFELLNELGEDEVKEHFGFVTQGELDCALEEQEEIHKEIIEDLERKLEMAIGNV